MFLVDDHSSDGTTDIVRQAGDRLTVVFGRVGRLVTDGGGVLARVALLPAIDALGSASAAHRPVLQGVTIHSAIRYWSGRGGIWKGRQVNML